MPIFAPILCSVWVIVGVDVVQCRPNEVVLTFWFFVFLLLFVIKWIREWDSKTVDRQTDRQMPACTNVGISGLIICSMVHYSYGTDKINDSYWQISSDVSTATSALLTPTFALCNMLLWRAVSCHRRGSAGRPLVSIHDALTFLSDLDGLPDPPCCPVRLMGRW